MAASDHGLPRSDRNLVACTNCKAVKCHEQFLRDGCVACNTEKEDITVTAHFHGMVGLVHPGESWMARVIGVAGSAMAGVYAAHIDNLAEHMSDDEDEYGSEVDDDVVEEANGEEATVDELLGVDFPESTPHNNAASNERVAGGSDGTKQVPTGGGGAEDQLEDLPFVGDDELAAIAAEVDDDLVD